MEKKSCKGLKVLTGAVAVTVAVGLAANDANATNGFFAHGYSIKNKALAGAGVALPLDSIAAATNPAGMAFVGKRIDLGLSLFNPLREYKPNLSGGAAQVEPGQESGSLYFPIPVLGVNWMLGSGNASLGIDIFGNGGMNTDYATSVFGSGWGQSDTMETGINMEQLFVTATYAYKLNENHSLGISPVFAKNKFSAKGLVGFSGNSNEPTKLTDNGDDSATGFGVRVGYMGKLSPTVSIGASYQPRIDMTNFKKYAGLFAEQGDFDIPSNWTVGVAVNAAPTVIFAFDVQQLNYSEVKAVNNPLANPVVTLGTKDGAGFGWEDMTVFKLGVQWQQSEDMTWRAGFSHGGQPIPTTEPMFNILAPGVIENHLTFGGTYKINEKQELDFSFMHGLENSVKGANVFDPTQTIELTMSQWEIAVGYSWKF